MRDISGTEGQIYMRFFYLFAFRSCITYVKTEKRAFTPLALMTINMYSIMISKQQSTSLKVGQEIMGFRHVRTF